MWMREHQRPWTLGAIVAADALDLKRSLLERLRADHYRRAWLVVGGDRGFWREERLCLRRGGTWAFVIDTGGGTTEARSPSHPELIPEFEDEVARAIAQDRIPEGSLHGSRPGLLLLGVDAEARTLYGLCGYREILDQFWRVRLQGRMARGTGM